MVMKTASRCGSLRRSIVASASSQPSFLGRLGAGRPSDAELVASLGCVRIPLGPVYDHVSVGGGSTSLTAVLYAAHEGIDTLVIDRSWFGGKVATTEQFNSIVAFPQTFTVQSSLICSFPNARALASSCCRRQM